MPDIYSNKAYIAVSESTVNTLTFAELATGISTFDKVGWIISRIEYFLSDATIVSLNATADSLTMGVALSNKISELSLADAAVVDVVKIKVAVMGTPATGAWSLNPIRVSFADMPGGGLIIPPRPIYLGVKAGGYSAPAEISCRIYYIQKALKTEEYWELVEATRMIE